MYFITDRDENRDINAVWCWWEISDHAKVVWLQVEVAKPSALWVCKLTWRGCTHQCLPGAQSQRWHWGRCLPRPWECARPQSLRTTLCGSWRARQLCPQPSGSTCTCGGEEILTMSKQLPHKHTLVTKTQFLWLYEIYITSQLICSVVMVRANIKPMLLWL